MHIHKHKVQKKLNRKTETAVHFVKAETEQKPQFFLQNSIKSHFFANRTPLLCVLSDNSGLFSICFYVSQIFTNTRAKFVAIIYISQTRSIQSGEKEHADLSGRSRRGHLVLVCAERRRPRPLLQVNRQHGRPAAQIFSDALQQIIFV